MHDYGIEQTVRDSRIAMVYEGTNEIQAIDLVQRKWLDRDGERLALLLDELRAEAGRDEASPVLAVFSKALRVQVDRIGRADTVLRAARERDAEAPLRVADDLLQGLGYALLAWAWSRTARAAVAWGADSWYAERAEVARFGVQWLLPQAEVHWARVSNLEVPLPWPS